MIAASKETPDEHQFAFYGSGYSQKTTVAGILGNTIEEKTRAILGWTDCGSCFPSPTEQRSPAVPQKKSSLDGLGPDRTKKRKPSSARSYPYDLLNSTARSNECSRSSSSRKSSSSSVNSLSSTANELSSLLLSHELTPPPSPNFKNQANGVTVVTLPRPSLPQPPPYNQFQSPIHSPNAARQFRHSHAASEMQLPISPVSPPALSAITVISGSMEDESISRAANFRPGASATEIFERLRTQVPHLSSEQSKFRILLQTVANVIELETKLAQLHEETRSLSNILEEKRRQQHFQQTRGNGHGYHAGAGKATSPEQKWADPSSPDFVSSIPPPLTAPVVIAGEDVPDDLQEIDVTAFRCLVSENGRGTAADAQTDHMGFDHALSTCERSNQFWQYQPSICVGNTATDTLSLTEFACANGTQTSVGGLSNPLVVDIMS